MSFKKGDKVIWRPMLRLSQPTFKGEIGRWPGKARSYVLFTDNLGNFTGGSWVDNDELELADD